MKRKRWKQKRIDRCIVKWQMRLRVWDWWVTGKYARSRIMSVSGRAAEIEFNLPHKSAMITLCDPRDVPKENNCDPELSIIHELLHLHMISFFDQHDARNADRLVAWEQAISILSDAFRAGTYPKGIGGSCQI
jgi:hypothetical protein